MRYATLWLSLLCVLTAMTPAAAFAATEPVGKVDALSGTAAVEREGRSLEGKIGDPVYLLDKWQTRGESTIEILFIDNSRVKMAPSTVLEVTEYLYNPDQKSRQSLLSMVSGKARFLVQDLQDFKEKRFRVRTQTAVVGTRDTDYIVSVKPESQKDDFCKELLTEALCIENAVVMSNAGASANQVILTANMLSMICGANAPTPPRFATAAERMRLLRGVEQIGLGRPTAAKTQAAAKGQEEALPPEYPPSDAAIPRQPGVIQPSEPPPIISGDANNNMPGVQLPPPFTKPTHPVNPGITPPPPPPPPFRGR